MEDDQTGKLGQEPGRLSAIRDFFALRRNIVVLSAATLLLGLGEEMWSKFIPKYLEALGAGVFAIGLFGTVEDLIDATYQFPGGLISDRVGRKRSLVLFGLVGVAGYTVYLIAGTWVVVFLGLFLVMASSLSQPVIFALIGDSLPKHRRAMGFSVQSILKRIPRAISPPIGGLIILYLGVIKGVKAALLLTIFLGLTAVYLQYRGYVETLKPEKRRSLSPREAFRRMSSPLRWLLVSDCLARMGQHITKMYAILYAMNVIGITSVNFGLLVSVQTVASMLVYIPIARLSDTRRRKPYVAITFLFFALYPLLIGISKNYLMLLLAYVVAGLREAGEPSRKAMIVDLAGESSRGSEVGLYYSIRGFVVMPGSLIGAALWSSSPILPFLVGSSIAWAGLVIFLIRLKSNP